MALYCHGVYNWLPTRKLAVASASSVQVLVYMFYGSYLIVENSSNLSNVKDFDVT